VEIPFTKAILDNGLDVVVHEDHAVPIAAVNVWYHVGSKNERPGRTGFAHLFEHLMFEGSAHYDRGFFQPLQEVGAALNGSTNSDRTNYWEVVPTSALERALWMESDRMGYLLPALTERKLANQRDVVINERRQSYENRPYGLASFALLAAVHPPDHPYSWPTIGSAEDVRSATLGEVSDFFRTYYHPGNASLVIAGDIEPAAAFDLAEKYFGEIPRGPLPPPVTIAPANPNRAARLVLTDRVQLPRLYLAWPSPGLFQPDDAELDLLATVLAHGKTSRLYRTLVFERRIATDVSAAQNSRELSGLFQITVTATPGVSLAELERVVDAELRTIVEEDCRDEELERSRAQVEAQFVYGLQTVGGFGGRSDQLNAYNVFVGDPGYVGRDLDRYRLAGVRDLSRAAATWLVPERRVALSVIPPGGDRLALDGCSPAVVS
jgi:zinc protease